MTRTAPDVAASNIPLELRDLNARLSGPEFWARDGTNHAAPGLYAGRGMSKPNHRLGGKDQWKTNPR